MKLRVSVAGSEKPTAITLADTATVTDLRAAIFAATPALTPATHRLRLISAGRLLTSPTASLPAAGLRDHSFVHCAVSELPKEAPPPELPAEGDTDLDASTSSLLISEDDSETRILLPATTQSVASLRAAGLSDDQIVAVRFPYLSSDGRELDVHLDELEANERISFDGELPEVEGSANDFWCGFILGALLGLIMLFLSMDGSIAFSRRWKMGIGYGAVVNVVFGIAMLANQRQ